MSVASFPDVMEKPHRPGRVAYVVSNELVKVGPSCLQPDLQVAIDIKILTWYCHRRSPLSYPPTGTVLSSCIN